MKRLTTVLAVVVAVASVGGCGGNDGDKPAVKSAISVFFYEDATTAQRNAVEARLRSLPKVTEVHLQAGEDVYKLLQSTDPETAKHLNPSGLPDSVRAVITDAALVEPVSDLIGGMPKVASVTGDAAGGFADPKAERGVIVKVDSGGQTDIEDAIKAIPQASAVTFESSGDAYKRMKGRVEGLEQKDALASYRFKVTYAGGISREQQVLVNVKGVRRVIVVPAAVL
ncbi:hypothetical protein Dvina_19125 [Dactylosporangium vinaceum]|uniref:Permease-like cell division protein FtsX n=1 Tax=Dactylosporangium vinaceum TaxID=53362 RepID=A0ABV5M9E8_9ACTN|nr:permease-like cell division protein FtsX [Dactylosporangium vinaceum]UAB99976.1 hypothetical protein Dvina_19125 [Dactylosporangium vinaceum]